MTLVLLKFSPPNGDTWTKSVVIHRPMIGEFFEDDGLLFRVTRVSHSLFQPPITISVEGTIKGNVDWELGHERGWIMQQ